MAEVGSREARAVLPAGRILQPTLGGKMMGAISMSSGSVILDAIAGGAVGYVIAPKSERTGYVIAGAAATGVGGILGMLLVGGYRYFLEGARLARS